MSEVSQPNEQLIETIEKALATIRDEWLVWKYPHGGCEIFEKEERGIILQTFPTDSNGKFDGSIIANFPDWLRALLGENKRLRMIHGDYRRTALERIAYDESQLQQTREELERFKGMYQRTEDQLGAEIKTSAYLRTELSAKDKVLEWYASTGHQLAKDILSKYRGETHD